MKEITEESNHPRCEVCGTFSLIWSAARGIVVCTMHVIDRDVLETAQGEAYVCLVSVKGKQTTKGRKLDIVRSPAFLSRRRRASAARD